MEGRITAIKRQKKDSARASIFLDEEFSCYIIRLYVYAK